MSTDIIDVTLHTTSFPPTYIGKGTLIGNPYQAADVPENIVLKVTSAGNAISIPVGFFPTNVRVFNSTDGIIWEQMYGMPAANAIKTTLGGSFASVVDTTGQITVSGGSATDSPGNFTVLLGATLTGTAKLLCIEING
jgi:hypothetical protein